MTTDTSRQARFGEQPTGNGRDDSGSALEAVLDRADAAADRAEDVMHRAGAALDRTIADARPIVAQAGSTIADSTRAVGGSSDENLAIGAATLTGFSIGLLLGGSNRLIVAAALLPATFMGGTLLARVRRRSVEA